MKRSTGDKRDMFGRPKFRSKTMDRRPKDNPRCQDCGRQCDPEWGRCDECQRMLDMEVDDPEWYMITEGEEWDLVC